MTAPDVTPAEFPAPGVGRTLGVNVRAMREMFLGAVYVVGPELHLFR